MGPMGPMMKLCHCSTTGRNEGFPRFGGHGNQWKTAGFAQIIDEAAQALELLGYERVDGESLLCIVDIGYIHI